MLPIRPIALFLSFFFKLFLSWVIILSSQYSHLVFVASSHPATESQSVRPGSEYFPSMGLLRTLLYIESNYWSKIRLGLFCLTKKLTCFMPRLVIFVKNTYYIPNSIMQYSQ